MKHRADCTLACAALVAALLASACGGTRDVGPANVDNPDQFLYERGVAALADEKWLDAREYFRQVVDNYPQSALRPEAKLGIGDAYLGEGSTESLVLADNEYREFLTFYPTNPRADYAQYKLAMSYFEQMRSADRDQTATRQALEEFEVFFNRFPDSPLVPEVKQKWREARDRLSEHSFGVARLYYTMGVYSGSMSRLQEILKDDPGFSRTGGVLFYMGELYRRGWEAAPNESPAKADNLKQAIGYYERVLAEYPDSEWADDAQERLQGLKAP